VFTHCDNAMILHIKPPSMVFGKALSPPLKPTLVSRLSHVKRRKLSVEAVKVHGKDEQMSKDTRASR